MGLQHLTINDFPAGSVYNQTTAPTINDDIDLGYNVGNLWIDTTNDKAYICLDNTDGAAVWTETTGGGATTLPQLTDVDNNLLPVSPTAADDGKLLFYNFSTGLWETDDAVTFGTIVLDCYSGEAGAIAKGTPVYLAGVFANDVNEVKIADADGVGTFPVAGFAAESLSTNSLTPGKIIKYGKLQGIDTSGTSVLNADAPTAWTAGQDLYISTTAGKLTTTRPNGGSTSIQKVAKVLRVDATGGQLLVFNTNRAAGLPNVTTDYIWQGDGSSHPQEVYPWSPPKSSLEDWSRITGLPAGYDPAALTTAGTSEDTYFYFGKTTVGPAGVTSPTISAKFHLGENLGVDYNGSNLALRITSQLFSANANPADNVRWEIRYTFFGDGDNGTNKAPTVLTTDVDYTGRTLANGLYTDTLATITGQVGAKALRISLSRKNADAADTYGQDVDFFNIDIIKV